MSDQFHPSPDADIEPERYELFEPARYRFELERRDFLRVLAAMGGGLLVVSWLDGIAVAQESGRGGQGGSVPSGVASWVHIDKEGHVTVFTGKVEIGQNIRTSLAQVVGDELRVPLPTISLVMADTDLTPFDQGTFGSQTTPRMAPVLARAAATARELLIDRAAARWQVGRNTLTAEAGRVRANDGRSAGYGELVAAAELNGVVAGTPPFNRRPGGPRGARPPGRSTAPTSSRAATATLQTLSVPACCTGA